MTASVEKIVKQLADSGVLAADTLQDFVPPKASPKDGQDLLRDLIRQKKLTKFQAEQIWQGKGKSLVLGNYLLLEKIGQGGMGAVYKAEHRRMKRVVAVKMLPAALMNNATAAARFQREVEAAAKLEHPNIVAAFDADHAQGVHLLVMQYIEGSDLSALVKKNGPLPVAQGVNCILQAARGLELAHKKGVVHRDIKPANLLLDTEGTVKVLDMGLARINAPGDAAPRADLTNTGVVMGTVDYMAPEQALDTKHADARSDIYSLGCSLFYLLTGVAVYQQEDSLVKKLLAHRESPIPRIGAFRPDVPAHVETIFAKMVAKKAEDRYQTMTDVIADLEQWQNQQGPVSHSPQFVSSQSDANLTSFLNDIAVRPPQPSNAKQPTPSPNRPGNTKLLAIGGSVLGAVVLLAVLVISLQSKAGTLVVEINERGADLHVLDNSGKVEVSRTGEEGPVTISVAPGKHRLKIQKKGFATVTKDVDVESKGTKSIRIKLSRSKPAAKATQVAMSPQESQYKVELAAAEWVMSVGGKVAVNFEYTRKISTPSELPQEPFVIAQIWLGENLRIANQDLARFKRCAGFWLLDLYNTRVTDAGLAHIRECVQAPHISELYLGNTAITDVGLSHLSNCVGMRSLWIFETAVTDAGLPHLKPMQNMTLLKLQGTGVTEEGVRQLAAALPKCRIEWNGGVIEPTERDAPK